MVRMIAERCDVVPLLAEVFRIYGFEGASLARITEGTKLGKGSIYHFFPGGKEEMAAAVLSEIDAWFRSHVFVPLRESADAESAIDAMFREVGRYFLSGRKVCLVGVFALGNERDRFAETVKGYFVEWVAALEAALLRDGKDAISAAILA
ncbi:MAG: TetR/AcrR family transcriptional regulator, partial [Collimonas sp.]|uniref:TetR/AcrR family transcriptional regulator n=1 Tax=Collimonas sp. TaxID=1963772 RepID=UPI003267EE2E